MSTAYILGHEAETSPVAGVTPIVFVVNENGAIVDGPVAVNANVPTVPALLSGVDLSMVNLESALTDGTCPQPQSKQFVFSAPASAISAFKGAGVTLITEANNHGEDCGPPSAPPTRSRWRASRPRPRLIPRLPVP